MPACAKGYFSTTIEAMPRNAVSSEFYRDYDELVNDPDPWSLNSEQAELRTLRAELRHSIEMSNVENRNKYYVDVAMHIARYLSKLQWVKDSCGNDRNNIMQFIRATAEDLLPGIKSEFEARFGEYTRITTEQAKAMALLMDASGKMAERHRKMAEQTKGLVKYDNQILDFLIQFVSQVVIPNVTSIQERAQIATAFNTWMPLKMAE